MDAKALRRKQIEQSVISAAEILVYLRNDHYLDLKQASEYLSLSERTIREHLKTTPHYRFRRKIIFRKSELDQWMETFRVRDQDLDQAMRKAEEMLA